MAATLALLAIGPYEPHTFLKGDCPYYAAAALSLLADGDFDLRNQIRGGMEVHSTQVALGTRGEWYPKHPVLMPLASLPFLALFGLNGALLFNVLVMLGLFALLARLGARFTSPAAGLLAALLVLFTTPLSAYAYNFSPDLFGSLLVAGGVAALFGKRPAVAGLLLAGAVWARLTNGIFLLGALGLLAAGRDRRGAIRFAAGTLPVFAAMAALQQQMFGAFWRTGYDRTLVLLKGKTWLVTHRGFFDYPFWQGFRGQLFLPGKGLLVTAPLLWLVPAGWTAMRRVRPREATFLLLTSSALFLLFCKYRYWQMSHAGNRFLFPVLCLAVVPLAFLIARLGEPAARPGRSERPAGASS